MVYPHFHQREDSEEAAKAKVDVVDHRPRLENIEQRGALPSARKRIKIFTKNHCFCHGLKIQKWQSLIGVLNEK